MANPPLGKMGMTLSGSEAMMARIEKVISRMPLIGHESILVEAVSILAVAKEKFVPVETGDLKDSGKVVQIDRPPTVVLGLSGKFSGVTRSISIEFGGGRVDEYAIPVHEHPSAHSPPSWSGKTIRWSKPGTGPKYLERPIKQAQRGIAGRMAARMSVAMKSIPGAFVVGSA